MKGRPWSSFINAATPYFVSGKLVKWGPGVLRTVGQVEVCVYAVSGAQSTQGQLGTGVIDSLIAMMMVFREPGSSAGE